MTQAMQQIVDMSIDNLERLGDIAREMRVMGNREGAMYLIEAVLWHAAKYGVTAEAIAGFWAAYRN